MIRVTTKDPDFLSSDLLKTYLSCECREVKQSLHQAKIRLKQSKRKDYYKILGVERSANDDEIKKAYKKRALATHPGATHKNEKLQGFFLERSLNIHSFWSLIMVIVYKGIGSKGLRFGKTIALSG